MAELISFVKPRQFLCVQNSYKFYNVGSGFNLSKGSMELDLHIGLWSSVFLNHYIAGSGARGVGAFEVGFDQNQPFQKQGSLCSVSPRLEAELPNLSPIDRDLAAVEIFKSGEVFLRKGTALEELNTAFPYAKDVLEVSGPLQARTYFKDSAFQLAFKLPIGPLPSVWAEMIVKEGLSWNWYDDGLVLSNSKSAYYGIPPNFRHLSLRKLELSFETTSLSGVTGPPSVYPTPIRRKTDNAGDNWRKLICAFKLKPTPASLIALSSDLDAHTEFLGMGDRPEYSPGSRKKKWTTLLVEAVSSGEEGSCGFPALAQALDDVAGKDNILAQFILLKKLQGQARIDHEKETIRYK